MLALCVGIMHLPKTFGDNDSFGMVSYWLAAIQMSKAFRENINLHRQCRIRSGTCNTEDIVAFNDNFICTSSLNNSKITASSEDMFVTKLNYIKFLTNMSHSFFL